MDDPRSGPALALLEVESIARGMVVADAVAKKAPVELLLAHAVSPGKFLLLFSGEVAPIEESWRAGRDVAGGLLLDSLLLTQAHPALAPAIRTGARQRPAQESSVGIVETHTVASALLSADRALKGANVELVSSGFARGIGGKGYYVLAGSLEDVEAALAAAVLGMEAGLLVSAEIIARPHADLDGMVY